MGQVAIPPSAGPTGQGGLAPTAEPTGQGGGVAPNRPSLAGCRVPEVRPQTRMGTALLLPASWTAAVDHKSHNGTASILQHNGCKTVSGG
ncbi:hypothetical protein AAFF_G00368230 [Aldrovandia affinis]|uniref:Uncharacterized protein n=1 Tax=Aldrovandia affinis TaxID=143900 RepID=A0AAD7SGU4_9TELE|nr:hypothetical protein AAFF_G00368230 [Aldrovandia affinis]